MNNLILLYQAISGVGLCVIAGLLIYGYVNFWRKGATGAVAAA